jgi:hypothetical protein
MNKNSQVNGYVSIHSMGMSVKTVDVVYKSISSCNKGNHNFLKDKVGNEGEFCIKNNQVNRYIMFLVIPWICNLLLEM